MATIQQSDASIIYAHRRVFTFIYWNNDLITILFPKHSLSFQLQASFFLIVFLRA